MHDVWVIPREVLEEYGSMDYYDQVVGMGPWIPTDYIVDSLVSFERNPDYWRNDPLFPDNQLPYADNLDILVILDDSTADAALRTGKLDTGYVEWDKVEQFKKDVPALLFRQNIPTTTHIINVRVDSGPFSDVRVRQAAMLAVDQKSIAEDYYKGNALIHTWPVQPVYGQAFVPLEDFPKEVQELYEYHPDKAKQLLAAAGYPDGFKTKFYVYPSQNDRDSCQLIQQYLKAVGIDAEIEVPESTNFVSILYGREYEWMISCWWGNDSIYDVLECCHDGWQASPYNFSVVTDEFTHNLYVEYMATADADRQNEILKEHQLYAVPLAYELVMPTSVGSTFWWPWLKGYHGEIDTGRPDETRWGEIPKFLWVDQDLKAKMK
jgi:peptide/nickel transport system substrate-binding protein